MPTIPCNLRCKRKRLDCPAISEKRFLGTLRSINSLSRHIHRLSLYTSLSCIDYLFFHEQEPTQLLNNTSDALLSFLLPIALRLSHGYVGCLSFTALAFLLRLFTDPIDHMHHTLSEIISLSPSPSLSLSFSHIWRIRIVTRFNLSPSKRIVLGCGNSPTRPEAAITRDHPT